MDKLDRLGWAMEATVVVNGVWVGVRVNHADVWPALLARIPADAQPISTDTLFADAMISVVYGGDALNGRRPFHAGYLNFKRVARNHDMTQVLDRVAAALYARVG